MSKQHEYDGEAIEVTPAAHDAEKAHETQPDAARAAEQSDIDIPNCNRSAPVPFINMTGTRPGTATLAFNQYDGEESIEATETFPEAHGMECFFVVRFPDASDRPELVVAFQHGEFAPVGSDPLAQH